MKPKKQVKEVLEELAECLECSELGETIAYAPGIEPSWEAEKE